VLRGGFRLIHDFIVSDDWKIAVVALLALAVGLTLIGSGLILGVAVPLTAALIALSFCAAVVVGVCRQ
jgi:hypothetical protein